MTLNIYLLGIVCHACISTPLYVVVCCMFVLWSLSVLRGGSAVGRWTCDLQVAGSIPGRWLSRNIGQLSLASLLGR